MGVLSFFDDGFIFQKQSYRRTRPSFCGRVLAFPRNPKHETRNYLQTGIDFLSTIELEKSIITGTTFGDAFEGARRFFL